MKRASVDADREAITVHIPMAFRKRGGRQVGGTRLEDLLGGFPVTWEEQKTRLLEPSG